MDFIQEFTVDCDFILDNIEMEPGLSTTQFIEAPIPELVEPLTQIIKKYLKNIEEFNYFTGIDDLVIGAQFWIVYISPQQCVPMRNEAGKHFNIYIFLKDSVSSVEFFNPFTRSCTRFKVRKGLCIVVPAVWMFLKKHTSTGPDGCLFVVCSASVHDLYNMQEA